MKATETQKQYMKDYYQKNRDSQLTRLKVTGKERRLRLKLESLSHYSKGTPKCARCEETDIRVLCMDHINNDGAKHRIEGKNYEGGRHIHEWLRQNNYPDGFQVLCANCNLRKSYGEEKGNGTMDT